MWIRAYGRAALLIELDTLDTVLGVLAGIRCDPPSWLVDAVPGARTLLVRVDVGTSTLAAAATEIRRRGTRGQTGAPPAGTGITVRVTYDGIDLPAVAEHVGCTPTEIVQRHAAASYVVAFIGFAPGFYFLAGGHDSLRVPRRPSPRTSVPRGAVALAGEFTGIYPRTGPGGWQVIGHTPDEPWDPVRTPAALLTPNTTVRFVEDRP